MQGADVSTASHTAQATQHPPN